MNKPRVLNKDEIECKVKQITAKGCLVLLYKTARTDMQILDETFGPENWQCSYETISDTLYCSISVYDDAKKCWVSKSDCGVESNQDAEKGQASDAFKRAGFRWGIGRELYTTPFIWLSVPTKETEGRKYALADFFDFEVKSITVADTDHGKQITQLTVVAKDRAGSEVASFDFPKKTNYQAPKPQTIPNADPKPQAESKSPSANAQPIYDEMMRMMRELDPAQTIGLMDWCNRKFGKGPNDLADINQILATIGAIKAAKFKADKPISDDNMPF